MLYLIPSFILAALLIWREIAHDRQVQTLLDRIQAPEKVLAERSPEPSDESLHVPLDDDDAYDHYLERVKARELV